MKHILSHCSLGLDRRTWRHNEVLKVIEEALKEKVNEINNGGAPKIEELVKINFVKEGKKTNAKNRKAKRSDPKWGGKWKVAADLDTPLVFPLVATLQRPDLVVWSDDQKRAIIMELTISWEDNIKAAEERKAERYEKLVEQCEEAGWEIEYHHIGIGARGFIDKRFNFLIRNRLALTQAKANKLIENIQQTVEKASLWLWLKRDDINWNPTSNQNVIHI